MTYIESSKIPVDIKISISNVDRLADYVWILEYDPAAEFSLDFKYQECEILATIKPEDIPKYNIRLYNKFLKEQKDSDKKKIASILQKYGLEKHKILTDIDDFEGIFPNEKSH